MSHKTSTICLTSDQAYFVPCTGQCDWRAVQNTLYALSLVVVHVFIAKAMR